MNEKKYADAILDFTLAIKKNKSNWKAYRYKGDAERELDDYKTSIKDYTKALELNKLDTISYEGRAEVKRLSSDIEGALNDYDSAITVLKSKNLYLRFGRALCNFHAKRYKEAINDLNLYLSEWNGTKGQVNALRLRGQAFFYNEQFNNCLDDLNKYFKIGGKKEDDIVFRGVSYYNLGKQNPVNLDSAIADLKVGDVIYPNNIFILYYLGQSYLIKNDLKSAEVTFHRALSLNSDNVDILFSMVKVKAFERDFQSEYDLIQKYLKLKNELDSGLEYYFLGLAKWGAKRDTVGAVQDFNRASELGDVDKAMLFRRRFELLFGNPKYATSVKGYISTEIDCTTDSLRLGKLFLSRSLVNAQIGTVEEMRSDIEKAKGFAANSPAIYLVMGALGKRLNLSSEATIGNYNKAIQLDKKFLEAHLMKAYFYRGKGDIEKGCESLKLAEGLGAKATESVKAHICKGTALKGEQESELNFVIFPYLRDLILKLK